MSKNPTQALHTVLSCFDYLAPLGLQSGGSWVKLCWELRDVTKLQSQGPQFDANRGPFLAS